MDDLRAELATLTAALRAYAEIAQVSGATGLPAAHACPDVLQRRRQMGAVSSADAPPAPAEPASNAPAPAAAQSTGPASQRRAPAAAQSGPPPQRQQASTPPRANGAPQTPNDHLPEPAGRKRPIEEAHRRLAVLAESVAECTRCRLHDTRTQTVFARGTGTSGICFVGEGPGADEDAQGYPFVGKAGQLLDRMIAAMGFDRDDVYVCNIVKCRPPKNRKPEADEMNACRSFIEEQLELIEPKVIVALGATALAGLLGISGGITRLRGNWRLYQGKIAVMPTFHPAYLLRQPAAKREVWNDLQEVLRFVGRPIPERRR